ncbi:MAG: FAD-binding protein [Promethearchaeota archaeon]
MADAYSEYMRKSIDKVEKTREARVDEVFRTLTEKEADALLQKYHPDFIAERKRPLAYGPSKGDLAPLEVVELLEAKSHIDPAEIDLKSLDYDVDLLIIGAGGTGMAAALWAMKMGVKVENVLISTKLRSGDANTMMAQGGIQAATNPNDSPVIHYLDVIGGGHYYNDPELVEILVKDAPFIIQWHEELGMMYDRDENHVMKTIHGGGTSRKRMHFAKDYTGGEIMKTLRDEAINQGFDHQTLEFSPAVELIKDTKGSVAGAVLYNFDTKQYITVRAKVTIMATGGFGRLHIQGFPCTNHYGATFDGCVLGYRAGAETVNLDAVQYHPTGAAFPDQIVGLLVTEKVRGSGAQVLNKEGHQFCYPLEPRDIEASALIRECSKDRNMGIETPTGMIGVWLDSPLIERIHGKGTVKKNLPAMVRQFARFDIDITTDPMLVYPTLHYQNGGLKIDKHCETTVPGLLAAGEVSGGVHGRNRLMGNSLLEINVFGRRAGMRAAELIPKVKLGKLTLEHVEKWNKAVDGKTTKTSPILLPEYRRESALSRIIDYL